MKSVANHSTETGQASALQTRLLRTAADLLARLGPRARDILGRALGALARTLAPRRRRIVERNIALCFPGHDARARRALRDRTFAAAGMAVLDTALAWRGELAPAAARFRIIGRPAVDAARANGGVLIAGAHFMTLELCGALLARSLDLDVVQRPQRSPAFDALQREGRGRHYGAVIDRDDVRGLLRRLRAGRCVWYATDQDPGPGRGAFVPFFGVSTATLTTTSRLARAAGVPVFFMDHWYDASAGTWTLRFQALTAQPTDGPLAETRRLSAAIEASVRAHPEQYLWLHRRFKTRPDGRTDPYR